MGVAEARRRRVTAGCGAVFAITYFASFVLGQRSDIHESASSTLANYAEDYNKAKGVLGWTLAVIAVLALIWFVTGLVDALRAAPSDDSRTLPVLLGGGLLAATITVASAIRAAPVGDLLMDNEKRAGSTGKLTPTFASFAETTGSLYDWITFFGVGLAAAALVLAVSLASRKVGVLPGWLRWAGYAATPVLAFVAFLNMIVLMFWVVAVSIVMARASRS